MVEKDKVRFEVVEVPIQTGLAIKDNNSGETYDSLILLSKIANTLEEIKKGITG
jgi:hypothetical protein